MAKNISRILIISEVGRLRDSLRVLLKSCYPLAVLEETETIPAALQLLADGSQSLVLLDAALPDEQTWWALEQFRLHFPQHRCVVLAHSLEHQKQAENTSATAVLLDGFTAESIFVAVETGVQN